MQGSHIKTLNNRVIVISPSGSFYGSEQVLYDYLTHTGLGVDVAVPENSILYKKLTEDTPTHNIKAFNPSRLIRFYIRLAFDLILNKYQSVYLNEAGPVKYILILSKLFRSKKFAIHVRIVEDTLKERWPIKPGKNVTIITISKYIAEKMCFPSVRLYDPFPFKDIIQEGHSATKAYLSIGIIGRITYTKGVVHLIQLLELINERHLTHQYKFILFGTVSDDAKRDGLEEKLKAFDNVTFAGFVSPKEKIYGAIDCVMHLSTEEPLGRIFLEAIDTGKPFIGINSAGIGEIAALLGIEHLMANLSQKDPAIQLLELLEHLQLNYHDQCNVMMSVKAKAAEIFNITTYTEYADKLLLS